MAKRFNLKLMICHIFTPQNKMFLDYILQFNEMTKSNEQLRNFEFKKKIRKKFSIFF